MVMGDVSIDWCWNVCPCCWVLLAHTNYYLGILYIYICIYNYIYTVYILVCQPARASVIDLFLRFFKHQWPTFETDMLGLRDADVLWTLEGTDQHRWNQTESHVQKTRTPSFWQIHRKWICWHIYLGSFLGGTWHMWHVCQNKRYKEQNSLWRTVLRSNNITHCSTIRNNRGESHSFTHVFLSNCSN